MEPQLKFGKGLPTNVLFGLPSVASAIEKKLREKENEESELSNKSLELARSLQAVSAAIQQQTEQNRNQVTLVNTPVSGMSSKIKQFFGKSNSSLGVEEPTLTPTGKTVADARGLLGQTTSITDIPKTMSLDQLEELRLELKQKHAEATQKFQEHSNQTSEFRSQLNKFCQQIISIFKQLSQLMRQIASTS